MAKNQNDCSKIDDITSAPFHTMYLIWIPNQVRTPPLFSCFLYTTPIYQNQTITVVSADAALGMGYAERSVYDM